MPTLPGARSWTARAHFITGTRWQISQTSRTRLVHWGIVSSFLRGNPSRRFPQSRDAGLSSSGDSSDRGPGWNFSFSDSDKPQPYHAVDECNNDSAVTIDTQMYFVNANNDSAKASFPRTIDDTAPRCCKSLLLSFGQGTRSPKIFCVSCKKENYFRPRPAIPKTLNANIQGTYHEDDLEDFPETSNGT